jgi:hypothetical protein
VFCGPSRGAAQGAVGACPEAIKVLFTVVRFDDRIERDKLLTSVVEL